MFIHFKQLRQAAAIVLLGAATAHAQPGGKTKSTFLEFQPGYYQNTILKGINEAQTQTKPVEKDKFFKADLSGLKLPTDPAKYQQIWHNRPVSQGNTGTCWCFSTTSFYESEIKRIAGKEVKLSELYTVYWEYVERARYWVQHRGSMNLGEGSETNAVAKQMAKYGAAPLSAYSGLKGAVHNHSEMFKEIETWLNSVKTSGNWNEEEVVGTVKAILNHYIGEPPASFSYDGKTWTPQTFLKDYAKLVPGDYVDLMSLMERPYWQQVEYKVPDNWWRDSTYYNVPLDDFTAAVKNAIKNGYGISIGGDVSEAGLDSRNTQAAIIPSFDIPSQNIDEAARQFRFSNHTTTDDHAMHLVGWAEQDGQTWFLIKDSGSGSRNCGEKCPAFGYYFFHEDFVKLKMMTFTIHKDGVKDLLAKFKK